MLDGTSYLKSTLTGPLYQGAASRRGRSGARAALSARRSSRASRSFLANPALEPVKGEDVACGNTTCYRVDITLTPDELAALGAGDLEAPGGLPIPIDIPDLSAATVDLGVLVAKDTTRLTGLEATLDLGGGGGVVNATVTFSKWDEEVSISAPPADQLAADGPDPRPEGPGCAPPPRMRR